MMNSLKSFTALSFFLILSLIIVSFANAQQWALKNPKPVNADLMDVFMINNDTGFICGEYQTILKTTDGGINWINKTNMEENSLSGITFTSKDTGYAAGWDGIMRTWNGGENWEKLPNPFPTMPTGLNDVFFFDKMHGWACGNYIAILRTVDGGMTWQTLSHNVNVVDWYDIITFISPDTGFVAGHKNYWSEGTLKKSTDGGVSWTDISIPSDIGSVSALDVKSSNELWIGSGSNPKIYHTLDGGLNWTTIQISLYGSPVNALQFFDNLHGKVLCSQRMFLTSDGGNIWQEVYVDSSFQPVKSMSWIDTSNCFVAGSNGFISKSNDGGLTWNELSDGPRDTFWSCYFLNEQTGFTAGNKFSSNVIYKTNDSGNTWTECQLDSAMQGQLRSVHFSDENNGWTVGFNNTIFHSINGGQTWNYVNTGTGFTTFYSLELNSDKYIWIGGTGKIIYSKNYGVSWSEVIIPENGFDVTKILFNDSIHGYAVLASNSSGKVYKTNDGGLTWNLLSGLNQSNKKILAMSFPDNQTGYFSLADVGVVKTADGGETFQDLGMIDGNNPLYFHFIDAQTGIAGLGDNFVSVTYDGGITWQTLLDTLPQSDFIKDYFFTDLNHGYLVGWNGLVKSYESTGVGINETNYSNYEPDFFPNPAHDKINFFSRDKINNIRIYDLKGQMVLSETGESITAMSVEKLIPGLYLITISEAGKEYNRKLLIE